MSRHAFLLVGVGPHATRFYLPALARMARAGRCTLAGAVELEGKGPGTMAALAGAAFAGANSSANSSAADDVIIDLIDDSDDERTYQDPYKELEELFGKDNDDADE